MSLQDREGDERQPLLANDTTSDSTYGTSSTVTPTGHDSRSPKKPANGDDEADLEAHHQTAPSEEDPEAQNARKNVTMILPALAVGVSFFLFSYIELSMHYRAYQD